VWGNVTLVTDPAGVQTTSVYTNLSELVETTQFAQAAGGVQAVTTRTYDDAGRLASIDGPLTGTSDETAFDHDALGRMTQVTQTGITLPGSSTPASVEVTYNEVGEQIKVSQPLTTSLGARSLLDLRCRRTTGHLPRCGWDDDRHVQPRGLAALDRRPAPESHGASGLRSPRAPCLPAHVGLRCLDLGSRDVGIR
jgi:hypothetical protein